MTYLFKSHYSMAGRSIIQINPKSKKYSADDPPNLVDICLKNKIKTAFLVDDSLAGIWPAYNTLKEHDIDLVFGLRLSFVNNIKETEDTSHKNIIFIKNEGGYKKLVKISSAANVEFFNKEPRIDYDYLHSVWSDDLAIAVPFYDSFLYNNLFTRRVCVPDFRSIKPTMFLENHDKPHDFILNKAVNQYASENGLEVLDTCSVYYERKEDFLAWKARKIMSRKTHGKNSSIVAPNLDHCSSNTFCIE